MIVMMVLAVLLGGCAVGWLCCWVAVLLETFLCSLMLDSNYICVG